MENRKRKWSHSLLTILTLVFVMVAGLFIGAISESGAVNGKTEAITVSAVARKRKHKKEEKKAELKEEQKEEQKEEESETEEIQIEEDGEYTTKDEVAAYLYQFGHLPSNYITKWDAQDLGWDNRQGNLDKVAPGKSIGGDKFGNYEELLPVAKGRKYFECDIDFDGGYRGAKRIIFSNDGLIFYTEDHYKTFEPLYDENGKVEK